MRKNPLNYILITVPVLVIVMIIMIVAACLWNDDGGDDVPKGFSAMSKGQLVYDEVDRMQGDLELVVVSGLDPEGSGRAEEWKFAYNNVTSGAALSSVKLTVDGSGHITSETSDPLSKTPIRNWSIDSTSAYSASWDRLLQDGVVSERTAVKVIFIYLLGDREDNRGCDWTIGLVLGSEQPAEVTVRVDGNTKDIISMDIG